ncbi:MAG TPA: gamma-glutamyltransferase family protein [Mycolicibacillus parakoreensis]|nr:gamma-glutamyltransferase family protein [Mycolicibacillus parakoreensis]
MADSSACEPFSWDRPYAWPRTPVLAANLVCTSQPLAAQAGLAALADGGTAVDAAIAAAITLTVVEPVSNGIGADAFALVWAGGRLHGLNASGRSPGAWTPEYFGAGPVPTVGWDSVTVPGAVSGWTALHRRFGRLPFTRLFAPALAYARDGFPVSPTVAAQWAAQAPVFADQPGFAATFLPGGRAPGPGELVRLPRHAQTLEALADSDGAALYHGALAHRIEAEARAHGAALRATDLADHRPDWVDPIAVDYRGYTLHELPPNGQGIVALLALGILAHFDLAALPADSAACLHLQIEAVKLAFADAYAHCADAEHMAVTVGQLLDAGYLQHRATLIDPDRARPARAGSPAGGTVLLTAADADGVMVSMLQSNYAGFGSGVVVPDTGIALHNRGSGFVTAAGHPNRVGPRKRPYHTIIPAMLSKDGEPVAAFGVMGGAMQPQGHVQVVSRIVDHRQNPQAACDGPRFRWVRGTEVAFERDVPPATLEGLVRRGHRPVRVEDYNMFGACQAIWRLDEGYLGVSDPRRDGQAVGF